MEPEWGIQATASLKGEAMTEVRCSFCKKTTSGIVIASGSEDEPSDRSYICENCIELCAKIIAGKREDLARDEKGGQP